MYVCLCVGVWEGEVADWEEPAKGMYGWVVGELLLPVTGGVQGCSAQPWAGPVVTPLLSHAAPRHLHCQQQHCPRAQGLPQHQHHHQHWPYHPLGLSHTRTNLSRFTRALGERPWRGCQKQGRQRYKRPRRHQLVYKVRATGGKIQPDGNGGFLPGNDWQMYNWRAAEEGLYSVVVVLCFVFFFII